MDKSIQQRKNDTWGTVHVGLHESCIGEWVAGQGAKTFIKTDSTFTQP